MRSSIAHPPGAPQFRPSAPVHIANRGQDDGSRPRRRARPAVSARIILLARTRSVGTREDFGDGNAASSNSSTWSICPCDSRRPDLETCSFGSPSHVQFAELKPARGLYRRFPPSLDSRGRRGYHQGARPIGARVLSSRRLTPQPLWHLLRRVGRLTAPSACNGSRGRIIPAFRRCPTCVRRTPSAAAGSASVGRPATADQTGIAGVL